MPTRPTKYYTWHRHSRRLCCAHSLGIAWTPCPATPTTRTVSMGRHVGTATLRSLGACSRTWRRPHKTHRGQLQTRPNLPAPVPVPPRQSAAATQAPRQGHAVLAVSASTGSARRSSIPAATVTLSCSPGFCQRRPCGATVPQVQTSFSLPFDTSRLRQAVRPFLSSSFFSWVQQCLRPELCGI